jgi:hypothetical protein
LQVLDLFNGEIKWKRQKSATPVALDEQSVILREEDKLLRAGLADGKTSEIASDIGHWPITVEKISGDEVLISSVSGQVLCLRPEDVTPVRLEALEE